MRDVKKSPARMIAPGSLVVSALRPVEGSGACCRHHCSCLNLACERVDQQVSVVADLVSIHQPNNVIDTANGLAVDGEDEIAFLQSAAISRSSRLDTANTD